MEENIKKQFLSQRKQFINFCEEMADHYESQSKDMNEAKEKFWNDYQSLSEDLNDGFALRAYEEGVLLVMKQRAYERPL